MNISHINVKEIWTRSGMVLLALLLLLYLLPFSGTALAAESEEQAKITTVDGRECAADEVIVQFEQQTNAQIMGTMSALSSEVEQALPVEDMVVAEVPEGETVESFMETLKAQPNVKYVQPNYIYRAAETVNDPYANPASPNYQYHLDTINAYEAWDTTMGDADVIVAVVDTGIDVDHPDFAGQIYMQTDTVDNDGNANDDDGHGTHVCGIIAAATNNGIGVAGIAPGVSLMPVDVFGWYYDTENKIWEFTSYTSEVIEGINYAVNNGADIINMSLGGYGNDPALEAAVNWAVSSGVVCVAAAGNDGIDEYDEGEGVVTKLYPSDYDSCISVISTDQLYYDEIEEKWIEPKSDFSNYGPSKDISAPGGAILSTYWLNDDPSWEYAYLSGTSMASPVVAAVAALVLSVNPALTVDQVKNILYSTAADLGTTGRDVEFGYGRVDAQAAVLAAQTYVPITGVSLDQHALEMDDGEIQMLTPTVLPAEAGQKSLIWTSSDEAVATVQNGTVTAVTRGTATITATTVDGRFIDSCEVTVTQRVHGVLLDESKTLVYGQTDTLAVTLIPENANDQNVLWASSDESIVTVDASGIITAQEIGTATITVTTQDGGFTDTCEVTVKLGQITSSVYTIMRPDGLLTGIHEGETADGLKAKLDNEAGQIQIIVADSQEITGSMAIGSGMAVKLVINGTVKDELQTVVAGDCNGDGSISISDYTLVRLDILDLKPLTGALIEAGDVNGDGRVSISDYTLIRLDILDLKSIH